MSLLETSFAKRIESLAYTPLRYFGAMATHGVAVPPDEADYRDYVPGDDYRAIDWHVCARHDELISRPAPAPQERCVYLLVDCTQSMTTGRPPKFDVACRLAALLGAASLARLDQLHVLAFADRIVAQLDGVRGRWHWLRLLRFLESLVPDGAATDLGKAAECLVRSRISPGLAVVIGDGFAPESYRRGLEILRHSGHAPCLVHVCSREDSQPETLGDVELSDVETSDRWTAVLGRNELARYRRLFEDFCNSVRAFCRQREIRYLSVMEDTSWQRVAFALTGAPRI